MPFYILNINSESLSESIKKSLEGFQYLRSYQLLFGKLNLPDTLLGILVEKIKGEISVKKFIADLQNSMRFTPIYINRKFESFNINIAINESVQNGGNSLKEECSFKRINSNLLVDLNNYRILLLTENEKMSSIVFDCRKKDWQLTLYFLYHFYISECRFKRSYLPCNLLSSIGIIRISRLYRITEHRHYIRGKWFLINNGKSIQSQYAMIAGNLVLNI